MKSRNGDETALGEIPWPSSPISFIVCILLGGSKSTCLSGWKDSLFVICAAFVKNWGNLLVGRVALRVVDPICCPTVGGAVGDITAIAMAEDPCEMRVDR